MTEREAKFLPRGPAILRKMEKLTALGPFRLIHRRLERQENRYLDTEGLHLRRARAVLKIRRVGGKSEVTFKKERSYRAGISERIEITNRYQVPNRQSVPGTDLWDDLEPVRCARRITGSRPLKEILNLRTLRRSLIFACGGEEIELDLDRVEVRSQGRTIARYQEIEVENLSADKRNFRRTLAELRRSFRGRLRSSRTPKVEAGLRLLRIGS